jgi:hypothetical protein
MKDMHISPPDKAVLRDLTQRYAAYEASDENREKIRLGKALNALRAERPMVRVEPEGGWDEILPESALACTSPLTRDWEKKLRQDLFQVHNLKDDKALKPFFAVPLSFQSGDFGVTIHQNDKVSKGGSVSWSHFPISDIARDLPKLKFRRPTADVDLGRREAALAQETFGDILPVRRWTGGWSFWWTMSPTYQISSLVGIEEFMYLLVDDPEGVHRLMRWLTDEQIHFMQWFEERGLLDDSNIDPNIGSGGIGYTDDLPAQPRPVGKPVRLADRWGLLEAQEAVGVSPEMFADFIFPYQLELARYCGLTYYGCCEPVDKRLDSILQIPNLRSISVSPWADEEICAARLGKKYVYCRKPNPTPVCAGSFDEATVRESIRHTLRVAAARCNLVIIMKDTCTLQNEPWRLERWVQIAREEIAAL